jgi:prepilin-type N-terminal cleavage/methylation domain-containing protein
MDRARQQRQQDQPVHGQVVRGVLTPTHSRGFTVIETMVVVAILAILAAFAAPSMTQLIRTQKVRSIAYDVFADLTYARSEAISRGHNVGIGSGSTNWINGWQVRDLTTGALLRQTGAQATGVVFTADSGGIIFDRTGRNTAAIRRGT